MSYQPTEQVKRLQTILETLDQKQAEVKRLEEDAAQQRLALERALKDVDKATKKAKEDLEQVRSHLATELKKMDPTLTVARFPEKVGA